MTYDQLVKELQNIFAKRDGNKIQEHIAVQFTVLGEAGGALYLEIADGQIDIQPYEYYNRNALVVLSAEVLMNLAKGKADVIEGRNNYQIYVDGDINKVVTVFAIPAKKVKTVKKVAKKTAAAETPAKKAATEETPAKKRPGRPKKTAEAPKAEVAEAPKEKKTTVAEVPAKKRPGRPKKTVEAPKAETVETPKEAASAPKRKPGRPKKVQ